MNREKFANSLKVISSVQTGRAQDGSLLIIDNDVLKCFNEECICYVHLQEETNIRITVPYKPVADILSRIDNDKISLDHNNNKLEISAGKLVVGINCDPEALSCPEIPEDLPKISLDNKFPELVDIVASVCSRNTGEFIQTCVNFTGEYIEALNSFEHVRCYTSLQIEDSFLVRGETLKKVFRQSVKSISLSDHWIYFFGDNFKIGCTRWLEQFPKTPWMDRTDGIKLEPALIDKISQSASKASALSDTESNFDFSIIVSNNEMVTKCESVYGYYKESYEVESAGIDVKFSLNSILASKLSQFAIEEVELFDFFMRIKCAGMVFTIPIKLNKK